MKLESVFRLSFYLTLAVACACLAQAESFFHAWFPFVFLPLAWLVFLIASRFEGRWVIHETAANYLGIFIGMATGGWILLQIPRSDADLIASDVPWPAGLLPHLGPLLLILLAVKLFRPKRLSDFWVIQTIGLMLVTLGGVLAGDPAFVALLFVYFASLVWCLALFYLHRARRAQAADAPGGGLLFTPHARPGDTAALPDRLPWRLLGLARAARWSLIVTVMGVALFMAMPRATNSEWIPTKLSSRAALMLTVGVDTGINADRVGSVELSPDPAFHVSAAGADGAPATLGEQQLWRVEVLDYYVKGRWITWSQAQLYYRKTTPSHQIVRPVASNAPNRVQLRFTVQPAQAGGLPLAEPLDARHVGVNATVNDGRPRLDLFTAVPGGDTVIPYLPGRKLTYRYTQFITPGQADDKRLAQDFDPTYREYLVTQAVPEEIGAWARNRLPGLSLLPAAARELDEAGHVAPEHHAAVSLALCRHFALSPDFTYSLKLRRQDRSLDPVADFLLNVKEGHCERFAAGLALSLRSLGVPARVIKGYRGAEEEADGQYVIRLDHAHSWVQALVHEDGGWYWLTLDPTPAGNEAANPLSTWLTWFSALDAGELWRRFVLNYNSDSQYTTLHYLGQGIWQNATARALLWRVPALLALVTALAVSWRRRRRVWTVLARLGRSRAVAPGPVPGFYDQLLRVLARRLGLAPGRGQTPLEFATVAADRLSRASATAAWSALPVAAAAALYRIRYAGQSLGPAEAEALPRQIA